MIISLFAFLLLFSWSTKCVEIKTFKKFSALPINWDKMTTTVSEIATMGQCFSSCDRLPGCNVMTYRGKICTLVTKMPVTFTILFKPDASVSTEPIILSENIYTKGISNALNINYDLKTFHEPLLVIQKHHTHASQKRELRA